MSPEETAVDFYNSVFPEFERHFHAHAVRLSMAWLREKNPAAFASWAEPANASEPPAGFASMLDVLVSPDGGEVVAATVGENRGVYLRLEARGRRVPSGWSSSPITATAGDEAEAINAIVDLTEQLEASGWTRYLVEDGELTED